MNRKEFLRNSGLGMAGLLFMPRLVRAMGGDADGISQIGQSDWAKFVVDYAMASGAHYADARFGNCDITGTAKGFSPIALLHEPLLGARIRSESGWRHILMRDISEKGIQTAVEAALQPFHDTSFRGPYWVSAHFPEEAIKAFHTSDPALLDQLNHALLRYGQPAALPPSYSDIQFCDIILQS